MSASDNENVLPATTTQAVGSLQRASTALQFETGTRPSSTAAKDKLRDITNTSIRKWRGNYTFSDLQPQEIRILKLFKGKHTDPLECMLFRSALAPVNDQTPSLARKQLKLPEYWALSYWWGEDEARKKISIFQDNGVRTEQTMVIFNPKSDFYVRDNLYAALRQLRMEHRAVNIWVDAICINQEDQEEKNAQVSMMNRIYMQAENVCVWLGGGNDECEETFNFMRRVLDLKYLDQLLTEAKTPEKWLLVVNLMKIRWFSRRWVIQELALAQKACVRWGEQEIQWKDFADAIALFVKNHDKIKSILDTLPIQDPVARLGTLDARALGPYTLVDVTNNLFRKSDDGRIQQSLLSLETLVSSLLLAFEASDPRDTIYAVLSIAKDTSSISTKRNLTWQIPVIPTPLYQFVSLFLKLLLVPGHHVLGYCVRPVLGLFPLVVAAQDLPAISSPSKTLRQLDPRIAPDYNKSLLDVLAGFMDYCIETSNSLDILCRHWAPGPKELTAVENLRQGNDAADGQNLPTWILSIAGHAYGTPVMRLGGRSHGDSFVDSSDRQNRQQYNASAGLNPPHWRFGQHITSVADPARHSNSETTTQPLPNRVPIKAKLEASTPKPSLFNGILFVKGMYLDTITRVSGRVSSGVVPEEALDMGGWPQRQQHIEETRITVPDQLWRTLVADRGPDGANAPIWYHRACLECLAHVSLNGDLLTNELVKDKHIPSTMVTFLERVQRIVWNRTFFSSKGNKAKTKLPLFGLAPPKAQVNDVVCIFFGCSVPVVLRPCKTDSEQYFKFIGECYVHGMMDGEAIPTMRPEHPYLRAREFELR